VESHWRRRRGEGDSRRRGTRKVEREMLAPAKRRVVVSPRVWATRIGSGVSAIVGLRLRLSGFEIKCVCECRGIAMEMEMKVEVECLFKWGPSCQSAD